VQGFAGGNKIFGLSKSHRQFDHIVSVGMFEHVGHKNYREFMKIAVEHLKDDGLFLLHTLGGNFSGIDVDLWTDKYIFRTVFYRRWNMSPRPSIKFLSLRTGKISVPTTKRRSLLGAPILKRHGRPFQKIFSKILSHVEILFGVLHRRFSRPRQSALANCSL